MPENNSMRREQRVDSRSIDSSRFVVRSPLFFISWFQCLCIETQPAIVARGLTNSFLQDPQARIPFPEGLAGLPGGKKITTEFG